MVDTYRATSLVTDGVTGGGHPALRTFPVDAMQISSLTLPGQISGVLVRNIPVAYTSQNAAGTRATGFHDDFYNRIRYLPPIMDLGALVSGQTQELKVWNQHPGTQILTALGLTDGEGITVTGPSANFAQAENSFQVYTITVAADGPATLDAKLVFDWQTAVDHSLIVSGRRVVVWPFEYSPGTKETLTWNTRVITANNGDEQRIRVRTSPRQGFSINSFIPFHLHNMAESLLYGWRMNLWGLPVFAESRTLTATTVPTTFKVEVDTSNGQFVVGHLAIIFSSPTDYELVQISAVSSTAITTVSPILKAYGTNVVVCPVLSCRMLGDPKRKTTGFGSYVATEFEAIKNSVITSAASATQFLSEDVFLDEQLSVDGGATDVYSSRVDKLDYSASNVAIFAPWTHAKKTRTFGLELNDLGELYTFRTWLHRRAGKLRPFWMPTHEVNFHFTHTGLINTVLLARDDGQLSYGVNRKHIMVVSGNEKILATIQTMTASNGTLTITIDVDLNREASLISHAEYLGLNRLASDRIEIAHGSNYESFVSLPVIEISP